MVIFIKAIPSLKRCQEMTSNFILYNFQFLMLALKSNNKSIYS